MWEWERQILLYSRKYLLPGLLWLTLNLALMIQCLSGNIIFVFNFTYPIRCLGVLPGVLVLQYEVHVWNMWNSRRLITLMASAAWWSAALFYFSLLYFGHLCGLVVRVLGDSSGGPGWIPGTTRIKKSSGSGTGSTQPREYKWGAT
jgi:hypothetical protein